jgi:hypothetical protein
MRRALGVMCALACLPGASAFAQSAPAVDVAVLGAYVRDSQPMNMKGVVVSAAKRLSGPVSIVGEVGRHSGTSEVTLLLFPSRTITLEDTELGVSGGLRFGGGSGAKVRTFAQILTGWNRRTFNGANPAHTWQLQPELGLDVNMTEAVALRLQLGWRYLMTTSSYRNEFRLATGVAFKIGG